MRRIFSLVFCMSAILHSNNWERISPSVEIEVGHAEGKGIGFDTGYSSLKAFIAPNASFCCWLPFLDLRGHVFNDGSYAFNTGMGLRFPSNCWILGANSYYDYRHTKHHNYHQISGGLEFLSDLWSIRTNGYFPLGRKKSHPYAVHFDETIDFDRFFKHRILINDQRKSRGKREFALAGGDLEIGFHTWQLCSWDLYAGAGPYAFFDGSKHAIGGAFHLKGKLNRFFSLEFKGSYDNLFKWRSEGAILFSFPFGASSCPQRTCRSRFFQSPEKKEIIVVSKKRVSSQRSEIAALLNPATGRPFKILFVDNTNASFGNGTIENPFGTLLAAQNASRSHDIIYVFEGNGKATGMNTGFLFKNFQSLLGSGVSHQIKGIQTTIVVPPLAPQLPLITNPGGNILTLANHNKVSGIHLNADVVGGSSIFGSSVASPTLTKNLLTSSVSQTDIELQNIKGRITIINNRLRTTSQNSSSRGISLSQTGSLNLEAFIAENLFKGHGRGISSTLSNTTDSAFRIAQNRFKTSSNIPGAIGISSLIENMAFASLHIFKNQFNQHQAGIDTDVSDNAIGQVKISYNEFFAPKFIAGSVGSQTDMTNSAKARVVIDSNRFFDHEFASAFIVATGSNSYFFKAINNLASPGLATGMSSGITAIYEGSSSAHAVFINNTINANSQGASGFQTSSGSGNGSVLYRNNLFRNGNQFGDPMQGGLILRNGGSGNMDAHIIANILKNNGITGLMVENSGTDDLCLRLLQNFSNTGYDLINSGTGNFSLEQGFNSNEGMINQTGAITIVPRGTCILN